MLSKDLEISLHRALDHANDLKHEFATLEHLLLALTEDKDAIAVLEACGVNVDELSQILKSHIEDDLQYLVSSNKEEAKPTAGFQRVVQRSIIHVQSSGRKEVNGANIIVALFSERESNAVHFLKEQEMSRFDAVNFISHGISKSPLNSSSDGSTSTDEDKTEENNKTGNDALSAYCINLNDKSKSGLGLGIFIGKTLLERNGAKVICRNSKTRSGAEVLLTWKNNDLKNL